MMFRNNFIVVVKSEGRILREHNGNVRLPFGSEYSILLKNKDSRKAVASISVDGKSVTEGRIIIDGGSEVELLGFLEGTSVRNRFKFIQKTDEIVRHRGDRVDDGIVTVEYWFEERVEVTKRYEDVVRRYYWWDYPHKPFYPYTPLYSGMKFTSDNINTSINTNYSVSSSISAYNCSTPLPDEGITVKGSEVNQNFNYGHTKNLENQSNIINIILKGYKDSGVKVKMPTTTTQRVECPTCGRKVRSSEKYCSNCGTYLM